MCYDIVHYFYCIYFLIYFLPPNKDKQRGYLFEKNTVSDFFNFCRLV